MAIPAAAQLSEGSFLYIVEQIKHHAVFSKACGVSALFCQTVPEAQSKALRSAENSHPHHHEPDDFQKGSALATFQRQIDGCQRCALHAGRTQIVFGSGNPQADLMFIGEGPGEQEDLQGVPFVGPAGELLTRILEAVQIRRDEVYITNLVKCRPPGNRNPEAEEIAACAPFLQQQIACVQPKIICALGRCAAQALLQTEAALSQLRGHFHAYGNPPGEMRVMPTYHPAYLLRYPEHKRDVWRDMQQIQQAYRQRVSSSEAET